MDKVMAKAVTGSDLKQSRGPTGPVNGSIRLPNGDSFRYVRSDIMREAIASVTHRDPRKGK